MTYITSRLLFFVLVFFFAAPLHSAEPNSDPADEQVADEILQPEDLSGRMIVDIVVEGNKQVSTQAILNKITLKNGQPVDLFKIRESIRNIYYDFKRFRTVNIFADVIDEEGVILHIVVEEKIPLKEVLFEGNSAVSEKEIREKVPALDTPAIDPEQLKVLATLIKKLYLERGYYNVIINPELQVDDQGKGIVVFSIVEGSKSLVKRIRFKGNRHISSKVLRSIMYTHEDWLLGFLDRSGTFLPERLEGDKYAIEMYYQSNGYFNAKVASIIPEKDACSSNFDLLIDVQEGDLYTINSVKAPGNEQMCEDTLLQIIGIKPGDLYSREKIMDAIKNLELSWGSFGYLYAHVEPSITPNDDTKTIDLSFHTELGNQVTLGKLTIRGNKKSRDKVIRRQIIFSEGDKVTNYLMDVSKDRIQALGYFDQREGVNWKIIRTGPDTVDLDLMLKEAKTGHLGFQLGFSGSETSIREPLKGVSLQMDIGDTNFLGTGFRYVLNSRFSHEDFTLNFNLTQPYIFDKPILGSFDVFHKRVAYEDFNLTQPVNEIDTGVIFLGGVVSSWNNSYLRDVFARGVLGFDSINYQKIPVATIGNIPNVDVPFATAQYNEILRKSFTPGKYGSFTFQMGQEKKSHPMHPTHGYAWLARLQTTFDLANKRLGFQRYDLDAHWYTPLIGSYDLIFHIHGFIGWVLPLGHRLVPYRELFHIGGTASVRGFLYGEIGPRFNVVDPVGENSRGDSIGGTRAGWINAELIFPITPDMNFKGLLFYDGGAGWNNPYVTPANHDFIRNNHFSYRHAVGFGIRVYNPMPLRIDWGFKLDPRKGEPAYEVHFNTSYEW